MTPILGSSHFSPVQVSVRVQRCRSLSYTLTVTCRTRCLALFHSPAVHGIAEAAQIQRAAYCPVARQMVSLSTASMPRLYLSPLTLWLKTILGAKQFRGKID